jgi:hypothetical protein
MFRISSVVLSIFVAVALIILVQAPASMADNAEYESCQRACEDVANNRSPNARERQSVIAGCMRMKNCSKYLKKTGSGKDESNDQ